MLTQTDLATDYQRDGYVIVRGLYTKRDMDAWCTEGPTHHVALGIGHVRGKLEKVARLLNIKMVTM